MSSSGNKKARKIIRDNIYITIATASKDGNPWVSPVYSSYDKKTYVFYWISPKNTLHSKLIKDNNRIAIVVFDSKAPEGTGEGIYIQAKAYEISDENEIAYAVKLLYGKMDKTPRPVSHFTGPSPRRIYKAVPEKFWINIGEYIKGYFNDSRIEVDPRKN